MKKILLTASLTLLLFASNAFGACTAQQFQEKLLAMQTALTDFMKATPDKAEALNAEMEKMFDKDIKEFEAIATETSKSPTPEGQQKIMDMGCDLYDKMLGVIKNYK